jgi:hypothetical protein
MSKLKLSLDAFYIFLPSEYLIPIITVLALLWKVCVFHLRHHASSTYAKWFENHFTVSHAVANTNTASKQCGYATLKSHITVLTFVHNGYFSATNISFSNSIVNCVTKINNRHTGH